MATASEIAFRSMLRILIDRSTFILDHVQECNAQDLDIEGTCPPEHPNECQRCYDLRMLINAIQCAKDLNKE